MSKRPAKKSAADPALPDAIARAALGQLDKTGLRESLMRMAAEKIIATMPLEELAASIAEEHAAEVGQLLVRDILGS